jgi:hypothetical protein
VQPAPTSISPSQFRIVLSVKADCQSTLRGIDKPLHSFDVRLPLYLRCLNGSLGLFSFIPFAAHLESRALFSTFASCLQSKCQLHPVDSSFHQSVARSIRWPLRRYNWCNSTRSFSRALSFFATASSPCPQPPPLAYLRKASTIDSNEPSSSILNNFEGTKLVTSGHGSFPSSIEDIVR